MPFQPSPQQSDVFNFVSNGRGSAFVEAVAGAGKTTTIVEACRRMTGSIAFAAYNKKIAEEIQAKVAREGMSHVAVGTFHSFGFRAWRKVAAGVKLDDKKHALIAEELLIPEELQSFVKRLVSLGKSAAIGLFGSIDDDAAWWQIVDHHDLSDDLEDPKDARLGVALAQKALHLSKKLSHELIDFDDMIYQPVVTSCRVWQNDWLLVDEAQDLNPARRALARKMLRPNGRAIFVGDRCQPLGTMVSTPKGAVPIEMLQVGDMVVSYRTADCAFLQRGRRINGITRRPYAGPMIVATTADGRSSRYTPNHKCFVSFAGLREKFAVYVMQRGSQFRVGKCRMSYSAASGLSARLHHERADALWLLSVHDTEAEAFFQEQAVAGRFGLPQLMFSAKNMQRGPAAEYLPRAWGFIGDNSDRGRGCLAHFGRDPQYPLFVRRSGKQQTIKRPMVVHAANLVSGVRMLPYDGRAHVGLADWVPITVAIEQYASDVVSLDVADTQLYVADGLTTHNCQAIYGFTGADAESVQKIIADFRCAQLPLTITYRCPKAVVAASRIYVDHIEAHPTAPEGAVRDAHEDDLLDFDLGKNDAVLCRLTAPLVKTAFRFIKAGIACHVEGRDIGAGLAALANRWAVKSLDGLRGRLEAYAERETEKLIAKGQEVKAEAVRDRVDTLNVLMEGCKSLDELNAKIEGLFSNTEGGHQQTLTLSTVHKSKGREWERVFILGFEEHMPSKFARQQWQIEQENNLIYVAFTRAKRELLLVALAATKKNAEAPATPTAQAAAA